MTPTAPSETPTKRTRSVWERRQRRLMLAHNPTPKNVHPSGDPFRYCVCHEAIVKLGSVWWHIYRAVR